MEWFGYHLDFPASAGSGRCSAPSSSSGAGGRSWRAPSRRSATRAAGHDAADRDGDHRGLRRRRWPRRSAGSTWSSGGSWRRSSPSCCSATGRRCRPSARPRARSRRWPSCCPTRPSVVRDDGTVETRPDRRAAASATSCWCGRAAGCRPTADRRRRGRARRVDDHRRVAAGAAAGRATGSSPARWRPTRRSGSGSTPSATTPRWPASSGSSPRPRPVAAAPRRSPTGSPRCSSTSPPAAAVLTFVVWSRAGRRRRGGRAHRDGAGDRLPARPRPGHPARHRAVDRGRGPQRASWSRTGWPSSACAPSTPCSSTRPARSPRAATRVRRRRHGTWRRRGAAPGRRRSKPTPSTRWPGRSCAAAGDGGAGPVAAELPSPDRPRRRGRRRRHAGTRSAGRHCCASAA